MPIEILKLNMSPRMQKAALTLPGVYNQIRGKRPEMYLEIVRRRADQLDSVQAEEAK